MYVIKRPLLTEKSTAALEHDGHYTFEVTRESTKDDIKAAVEQAYDVNVVAVKTSRLKGKLKRMRFGYVREQVTKKATVRLKEGQAIELF